MICGLAVGWQYVALDVLVVVLLLIIGLRSGNKGFIECLFSLISVLAAALVAFLFMNMLLKITGGLFGLQGVLENGCISVFSKINGFNLDVSNEGLAAALTDKNIPNFLIDAVINEYGNASIPAGTTIAMLVGSSLGEIIAGLISWILLFFLARLALLLVKKFLIVLINKISLVSKLNHLLGFAVGVVKGLLIVSLALAVISIIPSLGIGSFFEKTVIVNNLYNHNPINEILSWILA